MALGSTSRFTGAAMIEPPASGNGAIASLFHAVSRVRAVPEPIRSGLHVVWDPN